MLYNAPRPQRVLSHKMTDDMMNTQSATGNLPAGIQLEEMQTHAGDAARLLKALANDNRLMILCVLAESEASVSQLNERIALSQSALSQHLALLRRDGLVKTRRSSQTIYYSLVPGPAMQLIALLHEIYCSDDDQNHGQTDGQTDGKGRSSC